MGVLAHEILMPPVGCSMLCQCLLTKLGLRYRRRSTFIHTQILKISCPARRAYLCTLDLVVPHDGPQSERLVVKEPIVKRLSCLKRLEFGIEDTRGWPRRRSKTLYAIKGLDQVQGREQNSPVQKADSRQSGLAVMFDRRMFVFGSSVEGLKDHTTHPTFGGSGREISH